MKNSSPRSIIALLIFILLPALAWAQAAPAVPKDDEGFARFLFDQEEYTRAAGEYYRLLFQAPLAGQAALLFEIGTCYEKAREFNKAILTFEKIIVAHPDSPLLEEAYYQAAYCSYALGEYRAALAQIDRPAAAGPLAPRFMLLAGATGLLAGDWERSLPLLEQYSSQAGAAFTVQVTGLIALAREAMTPDGRSPFLAGLFSAVIPGSGKMYAGRWEDGLISLLLCGICGGLAAYHFVTDGTGSVPAWIYAGIGGVFYLGNIYGSAAAAEGYNETRLEGIKKRVRASVQIILP